MLWCVQANMQLIANYISAVNMQLIANYISAVNTKSLQNIKRRHIIRWFLCITLSIGLITFFCFLTPCRFVVWHRRFGGTCRLQFRAKEARPGTLWPNQWGNYLIDVNESQGIRTDLTPLPLTSFQLASLFSFDFTWLHSLQPICTISLASTPM
jgi:hypothetical protein